MTQPAAQEFITSAGKPQPEQKTNKTDKKKSTKEAKIRVSYRRILWKKRMAYVTQSWNSA